MNLLVSTGGYEFTVTYTGVTNLCKHRIISFTPANDTKSQQMVSLHLPTLDDRNRRENRNCKIIVNQIEAALVPLGAL